MAGFLREHPIKIDVRPLMESPISKSSFRPADRHAEVRLFLFAHGLQDQTQSRLRLHQLPQRGHRQKVTLLKRPWRTDGKPQEKQLKQQAVEVNIWRYMGISGIYLGMYIYI